MVLSKLTILLMLSQAAASEAIPQTETSSFTTLAIGGYMTCALNAAGEAYCWRASHPTRDPELQPVIGGLTFAEISVGHYHGCGLTVEGKAFCWGANHGGQLGALATEYCRGFVSGCFLLPLPVETELRFKSISAGEAHTCALSLDGAAHCWGNNSTGQLGAASGAICGSEVRDPCTRSPVAVRGGLKFQLIETGSYHTCGITLDGQTYCWGDNGMGRVGASLADGCDGRLCREPVAVARGFKFSSLALGNTVSCGMSLEGRGFCWGGGWLGSVDTPPGRMEVKDLCTEDAPCSLTPVPIAGSHKFIELEATAAATCGVTTTGDGYCWGQVPYGNRDSTKLPVAVYEGLSFKSLAATGSSICGILAHGDVLCWELSRDLQPTDEMRLRPIPSGQLAIDQAPSGFLVAEVRHRVRDHFMRPTTPDSDTLVLARIASLVVPPQALDDQLEYGYISIQAISSPQTRILYDATAGEGRRGPPLHYELRVNSGRAAPPGDLGLILDIPPGLLRYQTPTAKLRLFALIAADDGKRLFEIVTSEFDYLTNGLHAQLPRTLFNDSWTEDGSFEAVLIAGAIAVDVASVTGAVSAGGGRVYLSGFGGAVFQPGAFSEDHPVTVLEISSAEAEELLSGLEQAASTSPFGIRIESGNLAPADSVQIVLNVPDDFIESLPVDRTVAAFVGSDQLALSPSVFTPGNQLLRLTLPPETFTKTAQESAFETTVLLTSVPKGTEGVVRGPGVTKVIPPEGGVVEIPGLVRITFPAGAFEAPRAVTVEKTSSPISRGLFDYGGPVPDLGISVYTGHTRPASDFEIALTIPDEYHGNLSDDHRPLLFTLQIQRGCCGERIDEWYRPPAEFDHESKTFHATLSGWIFDDALGAAGIYEAVFLIRP